MNAQQQEQIEKIRAEFKGFTSKHYSEPEEQNVFVCPKCKEEGILRILVATEPKPHIVCCKVHGEMEWPAPGYSAFYPVTLQKLSREDLTHYPTEVFG